MLSPALPFASSTPARRTPPSAAPPAAPPSKTHPPPPPPPRSGVPPSPPATSAPPSRPPLIPAKSHQSGTIESHWNDLPTSFLSAPTSRNVSTTASRSTTPLPPEPSSSSSTEDFSRLLARLFDPSTASTLGVKEKSQLHERILKASITEAQKAELAGVLEKVLEREETAAWGRERVVEFVVRNNGVAGWAGAVRRGVECLCLGQD
ncbi:hypothetical protein K440DRAFT_662482 [Wilcoxina mikolae CBS 423.85]|nr:hypothetical protein K440DRAFT_662482 [Wilcoxina mikolae CBS 423.85]